MGVTLSFLAPGILFIITVVRIFQMNPLSEFPTNAVFLIAVAVVCVIAMFTTGAVISIREEKSRLLLVIHQVAPILITLSMG